MKLIRFGSEDVEVIQVSWKSGRKRVPYVKTYALKPGESWLDAPATENQWQHYVISEAGKDVPAEAMIASDLKSQGATVAVFIELWRGRCVTVDHELMCIEPEGRLAEIFRTVRESNGGRLGGFPDVIALFPDGRIALREAKCADAKDRLGPKQHAMADLLRSLFGDKLDLKVVQWSFK